MNILTARIAWALDLQRKLDAEGKVLPIPEYDYIAGFNVQPRHFDFEIVARSPDRAEAVAVTLREAKAGRLR